MRLLSLLALVACKDGGPVDTGRSNLGCDQQFVFYADADGDGYGDPSHASDWACSAPEGYVEDDSDCDDADAAVNPAASEVCDGVDNDCDALIDDEDDSLEPAGGPSGWLDADGDGHGDPGAFTTACAPSGEYVQNDDDCDDTDAAVNPDADELCDGVDNDCDGLYDDEDDGLTGAGTWYVDADQDGYGDDARSREACQPGFTETDRGGDCDDTDAAIHPGAEETWYDGVDADCDGADDDDADGDGDPAAERGGTDCDDEDPTRYGGVDCREDPGCVHPDATTLAANDPSGVTDIVFDGQCGAYLSTTIGGTDYVYRVDSSGGVTVYSGYGNYDIGSVTLDPSTGAVVVGYTSDQGVGYGASGSLPLLASSGARYLGYNQGPWSNAYMADTPTALAMDSAGCIWTPNWGAMGVLACVETSGAVSTLSLGSDNLTSLDLDSADGLYVSVDDTIYLVDTSAGTLTSWYVASDTILDFVFDYNDDLYVETVDDQIAWVAGDLSSEAVFAASLSGDAKLSISPEGVLLRMIGAPTGAASYEALPLPE